jgi:ornithine cyclodeaminase
VQGAWQLRALALVRQLSQVLVYDNAPGRAEAFARVMGEDLPCSVRAASSVVEATKDAEIIVAVTWSREPFLFPQMVQPGAHITTLGPDEPGKCEVAAELLQQGLFVCDDRELAISMGTLGSLGLDGQTVHAELGEVIAGGKAGRSSAEQITIYGGVGLAFQDLVTCWYVYQQVVGGSERRSLDFLS